MALAPLLSMTPKYVRELFEYCKDGSLVWRINKGTMKAGDVAGCITPRGYIRIKVNGKNYLAHRLIFLWHYGYTPKGIDHRDVNPSNNRICNLRPATAAQNNANRKIRKGKQFKGICFFKQSISKPWMAQIMVNNKPIYLGCFATPKEAARAYDQAALRYFGQFAKLNFPKEGRVG